MKKKVIVENLVPGFGADNSTKDERTVQHKSLSMGISVFDKGGIDYLPEDIEYQSNVGICTAIHLTQNRRKARGKKFSADFQYLLQKVYYDLNWTEGSSILNGLKVGKRFGFLLEKDWTWTTQADRNLPYSEYIKKLQAVPQAEIDRLITLCVDKIPGYASVTNNPYDIAKAIQDSEAGVLCRYEVGKEWFTAPDGTPTWLGKFLSPLRPPQVSISGHAIIKCKFDYNVSFIGTLANTWSNAWANSGCADVDWDKYKPTEVWTITRAPIITKFVSDLWFGMKSNEVVNLQNALKLKGFFAGESTGLFGLITIVSVRAFQKAHGISTTGYVGVKTKAALNKEFNLN